MNTLKDILIILVLTTMAFLCWQQEGDIISLRHRALCVEGGLDSLHGGLAQVRGGLAPEYLLSCSATVHVGGFRNGTGVFVSDNLLLTAKHVIDDRVSVIGPDGKEYVAVEILEDADDDMALIVIEGRHGPYLELAESHPRLGDFVTCIGTPLSEHPRLMLTWGRVSRLVWRNMFVYDGFAYPGCSGGAVVVNRKLVGIVNRRHIGTSALGFAAPIQRLDAELRDRILH